MATAGSCFAQHIARTLKKNGFAYFVTEERPHFPFSQDQNYGTFSARFGNIYTIRQLLQLYQRAYGLFDPKDFVWQRSDGRFVDPFRPRVQDAGFAHADEVVAEREVHLEAVRRMFEECDVFIFTLGLTEGWVAPDGAVVPLAPGVVTKMEDTTPYRFHHFSVAEMDTDLCAFITSLRRINPACRIILTVSPVALIATYEDQHVLTATTYSKSALRVVAEQAVRKFEDVVYFPSYEIITGPHARGTFFEDDLREVCDQGVAHVMSIFMKHYLDREEEVNTKSEHVSRTSVDVVVPALVDQASLINEIQNIICDEEAIEGGHD
ncbi:GSCFA domain-containing protein [Sediminicoccus sp. KRV36]|uniref:GSCFA domain-containing protein n=1 Tax=Sediminicoccus sp. KRV36 TaxID=3133721 RepID=UPI0020103B7E|nr:GSCFA domain-containing protein [Sediminicoccus rosea]UPY35128.1 GSCFA domain-containing protein [Sediminicoccus rosea]